MRRPARAPGVAWHVDVGIDHDHDLGPHVGGHGGQQGGPRLAGEVLLHRHDDAEGDAAEDGAATFSRVGNCWRALSRKEDFRDVASVGGTGAVNRTLR